MLRRLSARPSAPNLGPPAGESDDARARRQAWEQFDEHLAAWREGVRGSMWSWEAAALTAASSAADVATLLHSTLDVVAYSILRLHLS